ncbi:DUF4352 domain-containing protein [Clavibacter zhangzhiyongii]|uniref:DUF4352 domain-containing protein n=1 Tax=Clavibacter zhangzhiyongii TaxID=2768071 RepID=A0A7L7Z1Z0_9MICO|nr:DUF4352 domain-containing protein [Clavibacter zhangzhiyongii]QOD43702.1 DUF4352 domain-containing protein [Clavibacter zhangzhiyongii]
MSAPAPYAPAPAPAPAAPKQKNTIGLIALILAGIGFLFGVIPPLSGLAWIFFIPAIVLAIIGLTRKGQAKGTSISALILAVVGWIVAIIVASVTILGAVGTAIEESDTAPSAASEASEAAEAPAAEAPAEEEGVQEAAIGDTVTTGDGIAFTVRGIECGLAEAGDNEYLKETAKGQFCKVDYRIDNGGSDSINLLSNDVKGYIGESAYDTNGSVSTFGGDLFSTDVNPGLGTDNTVYIDIPAGAALDYIEFRPTFSFDNAVVVRAS